MTTTFAPEPAVAASTWLIATTCPAPICLATARACFCWPAVNSTLLMAWAWSAASVTVPIVKPPWPTLSATERAAPVTVVPLRTETVVARFSAVESASAAGLVPADGAGVSEGAGATRLAAGAGLLSSPPPEKAPATIATSTPTTSTPAPMASSVPRPKREPPSEVACAREPAPAGTRGGGGRGGGGVRGGIDGIAGAGDTGRSIVRAAAVAAAVAAAAGTGAPTGGGGAGGRRRSSPPPA